MDNFDIYLDQNRMWNFEGPSGVDKLKKVIRDVCGYRDHFQGSLEEFLADNPGAVDMIVEWIRNHINFVEEWQENLADQTEFDDEEEEAETLKDERDGVYPDDWDDDN